MVIVVSRVGGDGSVLTRTVDTQSRNDQGRWEQLAGLATLDLPPPPYRPRPGEPVYEVHVDERAVQVAESDLQGPLKELATAVLAGGDGYSSS
jgi:hypothetical protein